MQVRGFYKGVIPPTMAQAPINSITFGVEMLMDKRSGDSIENKWLKHCSTGAIAGFFQSFICSPMELVKLLTQHQEIGTKAKYQGNYATFQKKVLPGGIRGIYKGLGPTMMRDIPGFAAYFGVYEGLVNLVAVKQDLNRTDVSYLYRFMIGGFAGMFSWIINYPVDVIKTRIQLDGTGDKRLYQNSFHCLTKTHKEGGLPLLYRGLSVCAMRAFWCNSVTFIVADFIKENCAYNCTDSN